MPPATCQGQAAVGGALRAALTRGWRHGGLALGDEGKPSSSDAPLSSRMKRASGITAIGPETQLCSSPMCQALIKPFPAADHLEYSLEFCFDALIDRAPCRDTWVSRPHGSRRPRCN